MQKVMFCSCLVAGLAFGPQLGLAQTTPTAPSNVIGARAAASVATRTAALVPALATDEASRVGISRMKTARSDAAVAEEMSGGTRKWVIIIVIVLAVGLLGQVIAGGA